jgi:hypothetical protein
MNALVPASPSERAAEPSDRLNPPGSPAPQRPYPNLAADTLRGSVRCAFPLGSLVALAGLLFSDQGRDVLRALVGVATDSMQGNAIAGLVFLFGATALLAASIWYSMRWLLGADMAALPLPLQAGPAQKWVPRLAGGAAPAMVAVGLWSLHKGKAPLQGAAVDTAFGAALWFTGLAVVLVVAFAWRGELLVKLRNTEWLDSARGRTGSEPATLATHEPLAPVTLRIIVWALLFSGAVALLFFLFPVTLSRVVGAAAVAALALTSINLFGSFVLTWWPLRHGLPPLAPVLVLAAGLVFSLVNDNHKVQPAAAAREAAVPDTALPPDAGLANFIDANPGQDAQGRPLVLFVASEGGGIRAAYWTAAVLDALAARQPLFTQQLFALSGVSGGSLGVAAWLATQRGQWCAQTAASVISLSGRSPSAAQALGPDFVSPALAGLFYADLMQRFLPVAVPAFDRSRAIEAAWQRAFDHLPGQPLEQPLASLYQGCQRPLPHLLLNATRVETGQRTVLSRLPATLFNNTFDAMAAGSMAPRQTLAGLVHHSARFPLISPAGTVEVEGAAAGAPPAFRLVDGGYFDNSGVETALDLILALKKLTPAERPFRALLVLVRNEASGLATQPANSDAPAAWFPETGSILSALMNARGSHAVTARAAAQRALDDKEDIIDLVVPPGTPAAAAPLGWALSAQVRAALDRAAVQVAECAARQIEDRAAGRVPGCRTTP